MQYVGKMAINEYSHSIINTMNLYTVSNVHINMFLGQHVMKKEVIMGVIIGNILIIISKISKEY